MIGDYNVANLLGVIGVLRAMGTTLADAGAACAALTPVRGRMERVQIDGADAAALPEVVVDYAHTPDALDKALAALLPLAKERGGVLWCVFGCGGNRDPAKRPLMGAIACRLAGHVVVTSDNPRLEPPDLILAQILVGAIGHDEVDVIENRAEAIRHAVGSAAPSDVVLIAGKGHEDYQEIAGARFPFSDVRQAAAALKARASDAERVGGDAHAGLRRDDDDARRRGADAARRASSSAIRRRRSRASTATRAASRRAISSSPCAASASTPTTTWRRPGPAAPRRSCASAASRARACPDWSSPTRASRSASSPRRGDAASRCRSSPSPAATARRR